ncbi:hypothetical protein JFK97_19050 [Chromobacterium phragmitis]|uniref:hypothetical protein n=1 Tax=Chromobacterium amazonense TaxID=1382803 RepID=UPI0021B762BA|nr:hypothetical protein [Chromobacterium amazonense]MBM2886491.1 hypothetical protein [Chromobacterium amazonense]MDE1713589.1 hypothetical protein [Chromobacterium amazonense]
MIEAANRLILVDTNCLIRVYFSPLRPVLSRPVAGYELRTLQDLANELKHIATRRGEFAWLGEKAIQDDVNLAVLPLTKGQSQAIIQEATDIRKQGNGLLQVYCQDQGINLRQLSVADAKVLAAALELSIAMSTDEWPLRYVASAYSYDNGKSVELFSSVELIALLEREGLLSRGDRMQTYADWLKFGENLLRESPHIYFKEFGEAPPNAQH